MSNIFITYEPITDTKAKVILEHYNPSELPEEVLAQGELLESIPEPTPIEGKVPIKYFNPQTKEIFYEYIDAPIKVEKKVEILTEENSILKQQVDELTIQLGDLILNGGV